MRFTRHGVLRSLSVLLLFASCSTSFSEANLTWRAGKLDDVDVLRRANKSTVEVHAKTGSGRRTAYSSGAGVVLSARGYIVTAYHVVRDFDSIEVRLTTGQTLPVRLVDAAEDRDICLLQVTTQSRLEPASLAASNRIKEGRRAIVIGNPGGAGQQVIAGKLGSTRIVTWDGNKAPLRTLEADVMPGNSGGGAFDLETGELLGITVAKSSTMEKTGYVVPADEIADLVAGQTRVTEIEDARELNQLLGATLRPVILKDGRFDTGLLVTSIAPGSPADQAGWNEGDILLGLDRYQTKTISDVLFALEAPTSSLDKLSFLLARDQAVQTGAVALLNPPTGPTLADLATSSRSR